jgi:hypothetical protein
MLRSGPSQPAGPVSDGPAAPGPWWPRIGPEHPICRPAEYLAQPLYNLALEAVFECGISIYDAEIERAWRGEKSWNETLAQLRSP